MLVVLVEERAGYVIGHQVVEATWAKQYMNWLKQLFSLCSKAEFRTQSAETRAEFRDFSAWIATLIICDRPEYIAAVQVLLKPLSNTSSQRLPGRTDPPSHDYPFIGYKNYHQKIEEFVHTYQYLLPSPPLSSSH